MEKYVAKLTKIKHLNQTSKKNAKILNNNNNVY